MRIIILNGFSILLLKVKEAIFSILKLKGSRQSKMQFFIGKICQMALLILFYKISFCTFLAIEFGSKILFYHSGMIGWFLRLGFSIRTVSNYLWLDGFKVKCNRIFQLSLDLFMVEINY